MNCRKTMRVMPLHVGGDLEAGLAAEVDRHLNSCESCAEEFRNFEASRRSLFALKGETESAAPDLWPAVRLRLGSSPRSRRWPSVRVAAAAVLLVAAGGLGWAFSMGTYDDTISDGRAEAVARPPRVMPPAPLVPTPDPAMPPIVAPGSGSFLLAEVGPGANGTTFDSDAFPSVEIAKPERMGWDEF